MTTELLYLAWALLLAIVQTLIPAVLFTRETGLPYAAGPRDVPPATPPSVLTGRLVRAQKNLFETLPVFIGLVLIAHVANIHTSLTLWGAMLYFWARVVYVPVYALGIKYIRTLVWFASLAALIMFLVAIL